MTAVFHNGIAFEEVPLGDCLDLAGRLQRMGHAWHSHVLSPVCTHNPYPGRYAIVIEDDKDARAFIAPSDGFPEVDKQLVRILHGDDILDPRKAAEVATGGSADRHGSVLLAAVARLDEQGASWHHHMHFPPCVLNPQRGRWCITIEGGGETLAEAFDDEPVDLLRQIEVAYFGNLDKAARNAG